MEGEDERRLFSALIRRLDSEVPDIQIIPVGGKDAFRKRIGAINIRAEAKAEENGWSRYVMAVIRDADENSESAFQSACGAIGSAGLEPPEKTGSFTENQPSVGVLILPDNESPGNLETVCNRSVARKPVAECIDKFIECAERCKAITLKIGRRHGLTRTRRRGPAPAPADTLGGAGLRQLLTGCRAGRRGRRATSPARSATIAGVQAHRAA